MKKKEIGKKPRGTSIIGAFFGKGKKKDQRGASLFGAKEEEEKSAFYNETDDEGDSFNTAFYTTGGRETEQEKREVKEISRFGFVKSFTWLEYIILAFELFLVVYTILVLANLAPIF